MVLPTSGAMSVSAIQTEYNGVTRRDGAANPISTWGIVAGVNDCRNLNNFRGMGAYTSPSGTFVAFPTTSQAISLSHFYKTSPDDEWNCVCTVCADCGGMK